MSILNRRCNQGFVLGEVTWYKLARYPVRQETTILQLDKRPYDFNYKMLYGGWDQLVPADDLPGVRL